LDRTVNAALAPQGATPHLQPEFALMFHQLGLEFVRASLVNMATMEFQPGWVIGNHGELTASPAEHNPETAFPGAAELVAGLVGAAPEHTRARRQSPRRWALTWRVDSNRAIVAEAHYRDKHDSVTEIDTAVVRLACKASLHPDGPSAASAAPVAPADSTPALVWPQVERRAAPRRTAGIWLLAALPAASSAACLWLALVTLPQVQEDAARQQQQIEQAQQMSSNTLRQTLSAAMAAGDYGVLQDELSRFEKLGYFRNAVITNPAGLVVAIGGAAEAARIGDPVPAAYKGRAVVQPLVLDARRHGELSLVPLAAPAPALDLGWAQALAGLAAVVCAAAAALLALRSRKT
jgi:hypothetical protein